MPTEKRTFDVTLTVRIDALTQGAALIELERRLMFKDTHGEPAPLSDPNLVVLRSTDVKIAK